MSAGFEEPSESGRIPEESALSALQNEVQRLSAIIQGMNNRLIELEKAQGISPQAEAAAVPQPSQPAAAAVPAMDGPAVVRWESPLEESPAAPPSQKEPRKPRSREWEQMLGGSWLARIGILALVVGAGFFLKYAFDNNWIGPAGRIALGIVGSLILLGIGYRWQKRYPVLAQALSGGGIAILYLSIFAAYGVYGLINFYLAFGFLALVSMASAALALLYNSAALATIGILGAFIAPTIFSIRTAGVSFSSNPGLAFWLIVYIVVIDIGVLALSTFRNWRGFILLALLGSLALYGGWYSTIGYRASLAITLGGLSLIFLVFVGATTLFHVIWHRPANSSDKIVMVINAVSYFGIVQGLLWEDFSAWSGASCLLLALFYIGVSYIVLKRGAENARLGLFALGVALVFLTIAIPVQLGNVFWTTIAWAAEGTILIWLSFTLRLPQMRAFGYVVFFVTTLRLLIFDQVVSLRDYRPILNERFLAFAVSIAAVYLAGYFLRRNKERLIEWEKHTMSVYPILFVAANFFTLWILSAEAIYYFDTSLGLTALWALYAVGLLVVGISRQWRPVRLFALALLAIPIAKVFIYDVFTLSQLYRIISFVGLGVLLLVSAYLYQRYSQSIRGFIAKK